MQVMQIKATLWICMAQTLTVGMVDRSMATNSSSPDICILLESLSSTDSELKLMTCFDWWDQKQT